MIFNEGPFLQVACFCETVIEDKVGVLSLIRIIDAVDYTTKGTAPPDEMPPLNYPLILVLVYKSGKARGRHELTIKMEEPSGLKETAGSVSVHFEGDEKGQNVISDLQVLFKQEGLYWFHVYLDDTLWISIPFRVRYSRVTSGPSPLS